MQKTLVLILVGQCGAGKSAFANSLCNSSSDSPLFHTKRAISSVTQACQQEIVDLSPNSGTYNKVIVLDCPGLGDISSREKIHQEIRTLLDGFKESLNKDDYRFVVGIVSGFHRRITEDEMKEIGLLGTIFGLKFYENSILILTHADLDTQGNNFEIKEVYNQYIYGADDSVKSFLKEIKGGTFGVSNLFDSGRCAFLGRFGNDNVDYSSEEADRTETLNLIVKQLNRQVICCHIDDLELKGRKGRRRRQQKLIQDQKQQEGISVTEKDNIWIGLFSRLLDFSIFSGFR